MKKTSKSILLTSALIAALTAQEPTKESCAIAVSRARVAANTLPAGSIARKFADFDLVQARAEAGNSEFDDCLEYAAKALDEVHHPQHGVLSTRVPGS